MLFLGFISGKRNSISREMGQNLKKSRFTNKYPELPQLTHSVSILVVARI